MLTTLAAAKAINPEVLGVMYINTLMAFPFYQLSGKFAEVQPHTTPPRAHTRTLTHTQIHTQTHTHTHYVHHAAAATRMPDIKRHYHSAVGLLLCAPQHRGGRS